MQPCDIKVHSLYTNERGDYRRVIAIDDDAVVCQIERTGYGPSHSGPIGRIPLQEFAAWAHMEVRT